MVVLDTSDLVGWGAFGVLLTVWVLVKVRDMSTKIELISGQVEEVSSSILNSVEYLNALELPSMPDLSEIKDELVDIVEDFVGNLEAPRWQDHLMGFAQQFLQAKLMQKMPDLAQVVPSLGDSIIDPVDMNETHGTS